MVFQAATWLNNGRWLLVVREDSSAEFFNLESAKRIAVLVFVLALLAVSVTVVLITNKLIRRLEAHEAETERLHAQLEQSNRLAALGKFAAGLAHEINNPLAIIKESAGWMKELLEGEAKDAHEQVEELKPCIEDIRGAVRRCRDVTRHLLDFARSYEVKLGPTDVNRALTDAVQFLYKGASIRNVKVHTDLQDIPLVASDSAQLQQVFLNLLDNALYALNQRGDGNITVRSRAWEAGVRISIADDGPGIPRELRGKLFDPFFTTKPVGQGTGLGLSICYGIVGKLGGRLWVEHPPEGGATFHVYLPTAGPQKEAGG
jgi:two-component system NtrC family sensor kinase